VGSVPLLLVYTEHEHPALGTRGVQIGSTLYTSRRTRTSSCRHVSNSLFIYRILHIPSKGSDRENRETLLLRLFLVVGLRFCSGMPRLFRPTLVVTVFRFTTPVKVAVVTPIFFHDYQTVSSDTCQGGPRRSPEIQSTLVWSSCWGATGSARRSTQRGEQRKVVRARGNKGEVGVTRDQCRVW